MGNKRYKNVCLLYHQMSDNHQEQYHLLCTTGFSPSWLLPHVVHCPSYFILMHPEGTLNLMFPVCCLITVIATISWYWSVSLSHFTKDLEHLLTMSWVSPCLPSVNTERIRPLGLPPRTLCYSYIGRSSQHELTLPALKVACLNSPPAPSPQQYELQFAFIFFRSVTKTSQGCVAFLGPHCITTNATSLWLL